MLVRSNHSAFRGARTHIENTRRVSYDADLAAWAQKARGSTKSPVAIEKLVNVNVPQPFVEEALLASVGRGPAQG